jgi:hypothetical protein
VSIRCQQEGPTHRAELKTLRRQRKNMRSNSFSLRRDMVAAKSLRTDLDVVPPRKLGNLFEKHVEQGWGNCSRGNA